MKSLNFLFILLFSLVTSFSFGQEKDEIYFKEDSEQRFFGGIIGGLNATQIDGDTYSGYHKAGLNAGAIVYWRFTRPFGLSVEMLYSQKGSRAVQEIYDPYSGGGFGKYKIDLNYAEVPLLVHYFYTWRYQFGAGASYNALISSKESRTPDYNGSLIHQEDFPFNKSSIDFILSVNIMLWKGFFVNARYQYGLTPVRNWDNLAGFGSGDQYNNMFAFRLGYLF